MDFDAIELPALNLHVVLDVFWVQITLQQKLQIKYISSNINLVQRHQLSSRRLWFIFALDKVWHFHLLIKAKDNESIPCNLWLEHLRWWLLEADVVSVFLLAICLLHPSSEQTVNLCLANWWWRISRLFFFHLWVLRDVGFCLLIDGLCFHSYLHLFLFSFLCFLCFLRFLCFLGSFFSCSFLLFFLPLLQFLLNPLQPSSLPSLSYS